MDFITHEYSFTSQVVNIEGARVPDSVMTDGVLMYRVDGSPDPLAIGKLQTQVYCGLCMSVNLFSHLIFYGMHVHHALCGAITHVVAV